MNKIYKNHKNIKKGIKKIRKIIMKKINKEYKNKIEFILDNIIKRKNNNNYNYSLKIY